MAHSFSDFEELKAQILEDQKKKGVAPESNFEKLSSESTLPNKTTSQQIKNSAPTSKKQK